MDAALVPTNASVCMGGQESTAPSLCVIIHVGSVNCVSPPTPVTASQDITERVALRRNVHSNASMGAALRPTFAPVTPVGSIRIA